MHKASPKTLQFPPGCLKVDLLCPRTPEGWALELPSWKFLGCLCRAFPSYQVYHPPPHSELCRPFEQTRRLPFELPRRLGHALFPKRSWPTSKIPEVVLAHFEIKQSGPGPLRKYAKLSWPTSGITQGVGGNFAYWETSRPTLSPNLRPGLAGLLR